MEARSFSNDASLDFSLGNGPRTCLCRHPMGHQPPFGGRQRPGADLWPFVLAAGAAVRRGTRGDGQGPEGDTGS